MDARQLQERLEGAFPEASIRVDGGAGRFELGLVSSMFEGLNRVKRQQLVYRGLGDAIASGAVHAVTIIAETPEEAGA
jgi:acid stress-induced BolA-like protein IbaG/YrbA